MVWRETDKKTNDLQARHFVARDLERYVRRVETQRKAKTGISTNRSSTMPEDCVVFISLILMIEEFKDIMKNTQRKLEFPMPAAMHCKTQREKYRETCRVAKRCKTKYACIVETDESMRKRMEGSLHKHHEDHIAGKGMNSLSPYKLLHPFIPTPQAIKIPDAKATVEKAWEKREKLLKWQLTKVIAETRNEGSCVVNGSLYSELEPQFQKLQRSSRTPR